MFGNIPCAATVSGGTFNQATSSVATISGGYYNHASGEGSTVGGGESNQATGFVATVPGGNANLAAGAYSFAAGGGAFALNDFSFVWSDSSCSFYNCTQDTAPHQFVASASGGFFFYDASDLSTGVTLPSGSGSWNSLSDRNVKENFSDVDGKALLSKLAAMPILTWNYKAQSTSIRHMGPTAQDFREAFNLGEDEKHISTVDAQGVALAAVQELYKLAQEKDVQISELSHALDQKTGEFEKLEIRLSRLESVAERTRVASAPEVQQCNAFAVSASTLAVKQ